MSCEDDDVIVNLTHPRGDRFAFSLELVGSDDEAVAALVDALDGADLACHICADDGTVISECTIVVSREGDDMTIVASVDDTDDWGVNATYHFDLEATSEALGRYTMLRMSTVTVIRDWTRVVGS